MKNTIKKILSVVLVVVLCVMSVPLASRGADTLDVTIDISGHTMRGVPVSGEIALSGTTMNFSGDLYDYYDIITVECTDIYGNKETKKITDLTAEKVDLSFSMSSAPQKITIKFYSVIDMTCSYFGTLCSFDGFSSFVVDAKGYGTKTFTEKDAKNKKNCTASFDVKADIIITSLNLTGTANLYSAEYVYNFESDVYPKGFDKDFDVYTFSNLNEPISRKIYSNAFGAIKGGHLYGVYEDGSNHGHCYGMTSTMAALLSHRNAISEFQSPYTGWHVSTLSELFPEYTSDLFGVDVREYIKYGYVYQFDHDVKKEEKASKNNLEGLYNAVKSYVGGNGASLIINIYHKGGKDGHSIFPIGIRETDDNYIILINDSNIWYEQQEFVVSKDFSSWSYRGYSSNGGYFTYSFPANVVYQIGLLLNNNKTEFLSADNSLVSATNSISTDSQLEELLSAIGTTESEISDNYIYWLPDNQKSINLTSLSDNNKIIVSDVNSSIQVNLDTSETADFYVDDADSSYVKFDSVIDVDKEIILTTSNNGEVSKLVINGVATEDEITATQTETGLLVTGISDGTITLTKNDEVIATQTVTDAESDIEITYDKNGESDSLEVEYEAHEHTYNSVVTKEATCTETGVKTFTCECNDQYTETIGANGHTASDWIIDKASTCSTEGSKHIECTVCEEVLKTESIAKLPHNYSSVVTEATCETGGYTTYTCSCGDSYTGDKTPAKGHDYVEGVCKNFGDSKIDNCSCNCHKSGFMGFIWKIINFFQKLFKTNKTCSCGVNHY